MSEVSGRRYRSTYEQALRLADEAFARSLLERWILHLQGQAGATAIGVLSVVALGYVLFTYLRAFLSGIVLISIPLLVLACAGIVGLRAGSRWEEG